MKKPVFSCVIVCAAVAVVFVVVNLFCNSAEKSVEIGELVLRFESNGIVGRVQRLPPVRKDIVEMAKLTLNGSEDQQVVVLARCRTAAAAEKSLAEMRLNVELTHISRNKCVVMALCFRVKDPVTEARIESIFKEGA
jgi:hypothetical protein